MPIKILDWVVGLSAAWKLYSTGVGIICGFVWVNNTLGEALLILGFLLLIAAFFKGAADLI